MKNSKLWWRTCAILLVALFLAGCGGETAAPPTVLLQPAGGQL